jgi:hypothetical protein
MYSATIYQNDSLVDEITVNSLEELIDKLSEKGLKKGDYVVSDTSGRNNDSNGKKWIVRLSK